MLVCYALEKHSRWFILAFAGSSLLGSAYGFLQETWPFGPGSQRGGGGWSDILQRSPLLRL
jgi:hypothetical protein